MKPRSVPVPTGHPLYKAVQIFVVEGCKTTFNVKKEDLQLFKRLNMAYTGRFGYPDYLCTCHTADFVKFLLERV